MKHYIYVAIKLFVSSLWLIIWKFPLQQSYQDYQYSALFGITNVVVFVFSITYFLFNLFALVKYLTVHYYSGKPGYISKEELTKEELPNSPLAVKSPSKLLPVLPWSGVGLCIIGFQLAIVIDSFVDTPESSLLGFLPLAWGIVALPAALACTLIYISRRRNYKKFQ